MERKFTEKYWVISDISEYFGGITIRDDKSIEICEVKMENAIRRLPLKSQSKFNAQLIISSPVMFEILVNISKSWLFSIMFFNTYNRIKSVIDKAIDHD